MSERTTKKSQLKAQVMKLKERISEIDMFLEEPDLTVEDLKEFLAEWKQEWSFKAASIERTLVYY